VSPTASLPAILVVDDVSANRLALKRLLAKVDADIIEASSGNEALAIAVEQNQLAVILLDVQMPEMDGYEVAQFLREEPQTRHIPIIFVTAVHRDEQHMLKGYSSGAVDYISKPIIPEILMSKVQIFLDLWKMRSDLERANEKAQAAALAKDQFLSTMSHEIRTPMNGVLGVAELLAATKLDDTQQQYVKTILNSGELLLTILNDILDFTKLEAGKVSLEYIPFDLNKLCEEVLQLLSAYGKKSGLEIKFDYPQNAPKHFIGDPARIRQILFNLVGNGIKFTAKGYVRLRVIASPTNTDESQQVKLLVEDTGKGISVEEQIHLFKTFSQANASISRQFGGTGLGLAICQQLCQLMQGDISVHSTLGQGSTFEVELPLRPQIKPSAPIENEEPAVHANQDKTKPLPNFNRSLLLVEDTKVNQMVASRMLDKLGISTTIAEDGQQAIDLYFARYDSAPFDLIFMDCNMPVMDGFEATRQIRHHEYQQNENNNHKYHVPIVALTANATFENSRLCEQAGMDSVATKPFSLADLIKILSQYFDTYE